MTMADFLEIQGLTFSREGREILSIEGLRIKKGEIVALCGANGAGKTTLLSVMGLLLKPSGGKLLLEGLPMNSRKGDFKKLRQRSAFASQDPYLFRTTVWRNVSYGLRIAGIARTERRARTAEALSALGLEALAKARAQQLSGGEAKRVAIARALVLKPDLLLLDEPLSSIDGPGIIHIIRAIRQEAHRGASVVITAPRQDDVQCLAHKTFHMAAGRILGLDIVNHYRGKVLPDGEGSRFLTGALEIRLAGEARGSHLVIEHRAIALSRKEGTEKKANCFRGRIVRLEEKAPLIMVTVDAGELIRTLISREECAAQGLTIGSEVIINFDKEACKIY